MPHHRQFVCHKRAHGQTASISPTAHATTRSRWRLAALDWNVVEVADMATIMPHFGKRDKDGRDHALQPSAYVLGSAPPRAIIVDNRKRARMSHRAYNISRKMPCGKRWSSAANTAKREGHHIIGYAWGWEERRLLWSAPRIMKRHANCAYTPHISILISSVDICRL